MKKRNRYLTINHSIDVVETAAHITCYISLAYRGRSDLASVGDHLGVGC